MTDEQLGEKLLRGAHKHLLKHRYDEYGRAWPLETGDAWACRILMWASARYFQTFHPVLVTDIHPDA